jgi:hypothetical protein
LSALVLSWYYLSGSIGTILVDMCSIKLIILFAITYRYVF